MIHRRGRIGSMAAATAAALVALFVASAPALAYEDYDDPMARLPSHTPGPFLISIGAAFLPTTLCGRLGRAEDCFVGVIADFNIKLYESPRTFTLMLDLSGVFYRDPIETGGLGGIGLRLRFDRFSRFVPYGLAVVYAGFGGYEGGGGSARLSSRFALGGEISLRDGLGGGGVGVFLEVGTGAGCCTVIEGGDRLFYNQWFLMTGLTFP